MSLANPKTPFESGGERALAATDLVRRKTGQTTPSLVRLGTVFKTLIRVHDQRDARAFERSLREDVLAGRADQAELD